MTKEIWISANDASEIASANSGRTIIPQYIRDLAQKGRIASKKQDGRTNLYLRSDVEKIKVRAHGKNKETVQSHLPIDERAPTPPCKGDSSDCITQNLLSQNDLSELNESTLPRVQPTGTMTRKIFVDTYRLDNGEFKNWLEDGIGEDKLQATFYLGKNKKRAACFTPAQVTHNLEVLRKHDKLKE